MRNIHRQTFCFLLAVIILSTGAAARSESIKNANDIHSSPSSGKIKPQVDHQDRMTLNKMENTLRELSFLIQRCKAIKSSINKNLISSGESERIKYKQLATEAINLLKKVKIFENDWTNFSKRSGISRATKEDFIKINKVHADTKGLIHMVSSLVDKSSGTQSGSATEKCTDSISPENGCNESACHACCDSMPSETMNEEVKKNACYGKCSLVAASCILGGVAKRQSDNVTNIPAL